MAINRPTTKTIISTTQWGVPITDAVNLNTTDVAALKTATNVTPWANLTLMNGWVSYGAPYAIPGYRKVGDMVQIRGLMANGTIGNVAFVLPTGFRPPASLDFLCRSASNFGDLFIESNGNVTPGTPGVNASFWLNVQFSITP